MRELRKAWTSGVEKVRYPRDSPIVKRLLAIYTGSPPGKLSNKVRDYFHMKFCAFAETIAYKLTLFRIRRRISFMSVTLGGLLFGYWAAGWGTNWYSMGYR